MRRAEQNFWANIRRHVPPTVWAQRIENGLIPGMPDVFIAAKGGRQSWLELKCVTVPVRKSTAWLKKGDIRLPQLNWHMKALTMQVPTFVAVRNDNRETFVVNGKYVPEIHTYSFAEWQEWRIDGWGEFWDLFI